LESTKLARLFDRVRTSGNIYQNTKDRLREIGISLGYLPIREYFTRGILSPGQLSKIDEVWKFGDEVVAAFLIKSKYQDLDKIENIQQINKLQRFSAKKKFVVNVSKITGEAQFNEVGFFHPEAQALENEIRPTFIVLVKSRKHGKICLACLDENRRWIRPIKPGGFGETDVLMDNGKPIRLFDVVNLKLDTPCPIRHHGKT